MDRQSVVLLILLGVGMLAVLLVACWLTVREIFRKDNDGDL